jgi:hypothetical protein
MPHSKYSEASFISQMSGFVNAKYNTSISHLEFELLSACQMHVKARKISAYF